MFGSLHSITRTTSQESRSRVIFLLILGMVLTVLWLVLWILDTARQNQIPQNASVNDLDGVKWLPFLLWSGAAILWTVVAFLTFLPDPLKVRFRIVYTGFLPLFGLGILQSLILQLSLPSLWSFIGGVLAIWITFAIMLACQVWVIEFDPGAWYFHLGYGQRPLEGQIIMSQNFEGGPGAYDCGGEVSENTVAPTTSGNSLPIFKPQYRWIRPIDRLTEFWRFSDNIQVSFKVDIQGSSIRGFANDGSIPFSVDVQLRYLLIPNEIQPGVWRQELLGIIYQSRSLQESVSRLTEACRRRVAGELEGKLRNSFTDELFPVAVAYASSIDKVAELTKATSTAYGLFLCKYPNELKVSYDQRVLDSFINTLVAKNKERVKNFQVKDLMETVQGEGYPVRAVLNMVMLLAGNRFKFPPNFKDVDDYGGLRQFLTNLNSGSVQDQKLLEQLKAAMLLYNDYLRSGRIPPLTIESSSVNEQKPTRLLGGKPDANSEISPGPAADTPPAKPAKANNKPQQKNRFF